MKRHSPEIFIFGAGRVGGTLFNSLLKERLNVSVLTRGGGRGRYYSFNQFIKEIDRFDLIILSVPDTEIENIALKLSHSINENIIKNKIILHTSGTISFEILKCLEEKGFIIGSLHPYFSFYQVRRDVRITDIRFALSCDRKHLKDISQMLKKIKISFTYLEDRYKTPYHISAVFVSNFTALILRIACDILKDSAFPKEEIEGFIFSLLDSTLYNLKRFGIDKTITGPAIRRDKRILSIHRRFLKKFNRDFYKLYSTSSNIIQKIY